MQPYIDYHLLFKDKKRQRIANILKHKHHQVLKYNQLYACRDYSPLAVFKFNTIDLTKKSQASGKNYEILIDLAFNVEKFTGENSQFCGGKGGREKQRRKGRRKCNINQDSQDTYLNHKCSTEIFVNEFPEKFKGYCTTQGLSYDQIFTNWIRDSSKLSKKNIDKLNLAKTSNDILQRKQYQIYDLMHPGNRKTSKMEYWYTRSYPFSFYEKRKCIPNKGYRATYEWYGPISRRFLDQAENKIQIREAFL